MDLKPPANVHQKFRTALTIGMIFGDDRLQKAWDEAAGADREFFGQNKPIGERMKVLRDAYMKFLDTALVLAKYTVS